MRELHYQQAEMATQTATGAVWIVDGGLLGRLGLYLDAGAGVRRLDTRLTDWV